MSRLLRIWRSWSPRRRYGLVGGVVLLCAGVAIAGYFALKRPGDVSNPNAHFTAKKKPEKKQKKTDPTINWPTYGLDAARTRYLQTNKVRPPYHSSDWSFQAGKLLEFSPIVVHGVLYFMDIDAKFYALRAKNGKTIWHKKIGTLNASAPTYDKGMLYAENLEPGQAVALRPKDGKVLWKTPLPGRSESSPLVWRNKVIFGCECNAVYALDRKTGKIKWKVSVAGAVKGALARDGRNVFGGSYGGDAFKINAKTGKKVWSINTIGGSFLRGGGIYSTPTVAYGRVYFGSIDSRVYSLEEKTGDIAWAKSTGAEVYTGPAVADPKGMPPTVYLGSADGNFYAYDAKTGAIRWQVPVGGQVTGAASVIGNVVYVSVIGKSVGTLGLNVKNGHKVFDSKIGEYNPAITDGKRLYLTGYSELRAFRPKPPGHPGKKKQAAERKAKKAKKQATGKKNAHAGKKKQNSKNGGK